MAINALGENTAYSTATTTAGAKENPKGVLGKDDFLKLLLVELQYQDPTEPMDSEKILSQTSQLATLESTENTNKALSELAASIGNTQQFSTVAAIGKTADLGSDAIAYDEGSTSSFEVYFPSDIAQGTIDISDSEGRVIQTLDVGTNPPGVYQFDWDGLNDAGDFADSGVYHINARYTNAEGTPLETRLGAYPIESVRFEGDNTLVKVGSSYIPLENVREIY